MKNPQDTIKMDVPLFIRLLEYAREDASTDMDLHKLAGKAIRMSLEGGTLTMSEYDELVDNPQASPEFKRMQKQAGL